MLRLLTAAGCVVALVSALGCSKSDGAAGGGPPETTLAAAASLRHAMPGLSEAFVARHGGPPPTITYGSSGGLRKQVEGGAPVDGVLFASAAPVDALIEQGLADLTSRKVVATNSLLLVGSRPVEGLGFESLSKLPADAKLAIGEPGAVPAGRYAREAFKRLGTWDEIQPQLVFGGDVGMVLAYARRGEVTAAVVYRTDMHGIDDVVVLDEAEGDWAPTPETVVAVTGDGPGVPRAKAFLDFVASPAGLEILEAHGFKAP